MYETVSCELQVFTPVEMKFNIPISFIYEKVT